MRIYTKNNNYNVSDPYIYQNYHKHSVYTNPIVTDSCTYPVDYAKRADELKHTILSSCEHGWQGRYIEYYELTKDCYYYQKDNEKCEKCDKKLGSCGLYRNELKFLFAVEAYMVLDRFEKDNTNAHLVIAAKNENGRKAINRILSEANLTGYYYRARVDYELLMQLPEDDVWITSACLGGLNKYTNDSDKSEEILLALSQHTEYDSPYEMMIDKLHQKFKDNFFLEVQAHNVLQQKEWNLEIVRLSKKYSIEIIAGVDSHYIYEEDAWKRDYLQKSSGIFMEEEQGFYMDYPDGKTLFRRFQTQGALTDEEIFVAMNNTNMFLQVEEYTSPIFNHDLKMPSAIKYRHMTKQEKQQKLMKIVKDSWEVEKQNIPQEKHEHYLREIIKELDTIFKINHEDYFLLNYEIIKDAVENRGGMITFSGRGCLYGKSEVDTLNGNVYLEDIKIGDFVKSEDGNYHEVLNTMQYDITEDLCVIHTEQNSVILTKDHKIKTQRGWIKAEDLCVGEDKVITFSENNEEILILVTDREIVKNIFKVYDITVKDMHSYVANGIVVHNSGPSFYVNHLLGFTQIDRIASPITLYPERFLSTSRMQAGSLADIDFNCGNTPVFEDAQKYIMGENNAFPMVTYGTQKPKAAWKMFCRAVDVPFDVANSISEKITEYETDLKYWDEDSGEDEPQVYDYIPEDLREYFDRSKEFLGIVVSASRHACGNILYSEDITEEFGIVKLKSKGGKETIVACCDGKWIEKYLMLKNDLLTVACVTLNYLLYQRLKLKHMSLEGLLEECRKHPEVWTVYEKGYTIGLNQVEKNSTKRKVMRYKPKNVSELSAFIAGIRPAFKSLLEKLINREHFEYGIPTLDKLLQTEELPESFILYQEQIMKILAFAGIPMGDCYTVIKSISKKRYAKIMHYKQQFLVGMKQKLIEEEQVSETRADEVANTVWQIIDDASAYGFNSSHSLSVSFDSLLAAYFKVLYPIEFYEVYLNLQMTRSDKAKALLATKEMKDAFDIKLLPMRFGQDNRKYTAMNEINSLTNCLKSIKGFGDIVGEELFRLARHKYNDFLELLIAKRDYVKLYPLEVWEDYTKENMVADNINNEIIKCLKIYEEQKDNKDFKVNKKPLTLKNVFSLSEVEGLYNVFEQSKPYWKIAVNDTQMETLIMLNYFEDFGYNNKLMQIFKLFCNYYGGVQLKKSEVDKKGLNMEVLLKYIHKETEALYKDIDYAGYIRELAEGIPNQYVALPKQLKFERELLEIPIFQNPQLPQTWNYVLGYKTYGDKVNNPYVILYNLNNGTITSCKVQSSKFFRDEPFGIYSIINVTKIEDVPKKKNVDGKWVVTNEMRTVLKTYEVVLRDKSEEIKEVLKDE